MNSRPLGVSLWWSGLFIALGTSAAVAWYSVRPVEPVPSTILPPSLPTPNQEVVLDEEQRGFLWQVEHYGNELSRGKHGFRDVADALQAGSPEALEALMAPDFKGRLLDEPPEVSIVNDFSKVTRTRAAGKPLKAVDRSEFIAELLRYRQLFAQPPQVKLALMTLAPMDRANVDGTWQGTCQLRMWGEGEAGCPGEVEAYLEYQLPVPTKENLEQDGWLQACSITQALVGTSTSFLMREVARERGLDVDALHDNWKIEDLEHPPASSGGVYLADYNRDGFTDLLVTDIALDYGFALYRGLPEGKFQDVTVDVGLPRLRRAADAAEQAAAFVDLDGDGWQDLLLAGRVFRNKAGTEFVDVTILTNRQTIPRDISAIAVADFDRDGRMDLYLTRPAESEAGAWVNNEGSRSRGNLLWRNLGDWRFEDVTAKSGTRGGNRSVFTALWLDVNNDLFPDLYVIHEFGNGVLLTNNGDGTFSEDSLVRNGPGDFGSMGATCGDVDNDGNVDLYLAQMYSKAGKRVIGNLREDSYRPEIMGKLRRLVTGSQLYLNRGHRTFDRVGDEKQVAAVGWAYGPALVDLDNDGWLDIHATCGYISRSRTKPDG